MNQLLDCKSCKKRVRIYGRDTQNGLICKAVKKVACKEVGKEMVGFSVALSTENIENSLCCSLSLLDNYFFFEILPKTKWVYFDNM